MGTLDAADTKKVRHAKRGEKRHPSQQGLINGVLKSGRTNESVKEKQAVVTSNQRKLPTASREACGTR
jgi:hypothetical protein